MKKLLAIVAITSFLAACNGKTEDSTTITTKDSITTESPLTDAVITADSVNKKMEDSTGKLMDSTTMK